MPALVWLLAALFALGALQLLALRYAMRGADGPVEGQATVTPGVEPAAGQGVDDPDGRRRCPRCDAENRPGYTYCRNCAGFLTG